MGNLEQKLEAAGVFKEAEALRLLVDCEEFWENRPYETRLYFGEDNNHYLHRNVLRAAVKLLDEPCLKARVKELEEELEAKKALCVSLSNGERILWEKIRQLEAKLKNNESNDK